MSELTDTRSDRRDPDLDDDRLREECGVFGIFGHPDAAALTALGLHALQHRGQEAAGIVTFDGERFHSERRLGLVGDTFPSASVIDRLPGQHRPSATSATRPPARPSCATSSRCSPSSTAAASPSPTTAISPTRLTLRRELVRDGAIFQSTTDTEVILHLRGAPRRKPLRRPLHRGAAPASRAPIRWSSLTNKKLIGARDPLGIRPLVLGELDGASILASETCALDIIGAQVRARRRDRRRSWSSPRTASQATSRSRRSGARPASSNTSISRGRIQLVGGRTVYDVRKSMGARARARSAGRRRRGRAGAGLRRAGGARLLRSESGIPFELGIIRNHYVGRTFIQPTQPIRDLGVRAEAQRQPRGGRRASASCWSTIPSCAAPPRARSCR